MANYTKRDKRKEWAEEMAAHRSDRATGKPLPACWCGGVAVLEVSLSDGARYFCARHEAGGEALFQDAKR
jgi:hypothetical protein